ncbi:cortical protein marker for cell polarity-domain-containing protein [Mycena floridula]|nr:cortical protein marker for cell polarity-domain-containing protein [Mycena floridula]
MQRLSLFALFLLPQVTNAALPLVDFDRMGKVGLAGSFAGLDLFTNSPVSFDKSTSTLLSRSTSGSLSRLASSNTGGRISAGCSLNDIFYFAGSFSSIDSVSAANVASYTPSSNSFAALGSNGPNGQVDAVFCDTKNNKLWVGGKFTSPGASVAVWDVKASSWSSPPFGGFSGAQAHVSSITTNSSASSLFFAGSFIASFQGNESALTGSNNPNVPFSAGASPFSSSLVPVPLGDAELSPASSGDASFGNLANILCPAGADGPGNTWFARDGAVATVTVRAFSFISANGIRLGNTFLPNHGTTGFSVTTIPDNAVRTLKYVDPTTNENKTCSDPCPLSTDSSLLYQDFLFDDVLTITGFIIKLSEWTGDGPGLHLMQLLSSGAFASAVDSENGQSCFAPNPSNTTRTGDWSAKVADTDIAGTTQTVLVSTVAVGTSSSNGPSLTWIPYVSASGQYEVSMLVPGCNNFQDCALRTSVKVVVFPGHGIDPSVNTISQTGPTDTLTVIYSGPIVPSSPDFVTTIVMTLADQPVGTGQDGKYELVADRIQLKLISPNLSSNGSSGSGTSSSGTKSSFGFFEWPLSSGSSIDATGIIPNTSETSLDAVGFSLFNGAGGSSSLSSSTSSISTVAYHSSGSIFVGGNLTLSSGSAAGARNLAVYKNGGLANLADNGLNGPVTSLVIVGDELFVGGSFSDTSSESMQGKLAGVALYNVQQDSWASLAFGVNGQVTDLDYVNGQLQVTGNFTKILSSSSSGAGIDASGLAVWDIKEAAWVNNGGFLVGSMTFVGDGTSSMQYIAGNVEASLPFGASGMVILQNSKTDVPTITPLSLQLDGSTISPATSTTRRSVRRASWISHVKLSKLWSRQSTTTLASLPDPLPALAPTVLAGAFWTNSSSKVEVAIIGGNFSFLATGASTESRAVGIYDQSSNTVVGLQGAQINGTVRTLFVDSDRLYIGGQFTLSGADVNGFAVYDLSGQQWVSGVPALQASSGSNVVVRSITKSTAKTNTVVVAGSFAQGGSLRCQAICFLDTSSNQWNSLGNGILGDIAAVSYSGSKQDSLIVSGSIALSDNTAANVAEFVFANSSWAAIGQGADLPGPVTAVEVNGGNGNSIFAAGKSTDGTSFLSFWNGLKWNTLSSTLESTSTVAQLAMVPLQDTHSANGVIEPDRMLMISGLLDDSSFGNASSALFDGQTFFPYITSTASSGSSGTVSSLFHSFATFSFSQHHFLATGVVILISIAIAAGVVFLFTLIGILWTLFSRRDDKLNKLDMAEDDDDDSTHHRPSSLLEHINAATRTTILGASPYYHGEKEEEKGGHRDPISPQETDPFGPDASNYLRAETPSDAVGGIMSEEPSRPAHARYSFDGTGEGELALTAGAEVEVLDDRDAAWWYARDVRTGQEGVVPAAYLY